MSETIQLIRNSFSWHRQCCCCIMDDADDEDDDEWWITMMMMMMNDGLWWRCLFINNYFFATMKTILIILIQKIFSKKFGFRRAKNQLMRTDFFSSSRCPMCPDRGPHGCWTPVGYSDKLARSFDNICQDTYRYVLFLKSKLRIDHDSAFAFYYSGFSGSNLIFFKARVIISPDFIGQHKATVQAFPDMCTRCLRGNVCTPSPGYATAEDCFGA